MYFFYCFLIYQTVVMVDVTECVLIDWGNLIKMSIWIVWMQCLISNIQFDQNKKNEFCVWGSKWILTDPFSVPMRKIDSANIINLWKEKLWFKKKVHRTTDGNEKKKFTEKWLENHCSMWFDHHKAADYWQKYLEKPIKTQMQKVNKQQNQREKKKSSSLSRPQM